MYSKLTHTKIEGEGWLGSAVRITAIFDVAPDSVTITVRDPSNIDKRDDVAMTMLTSADRVYEYVYQSGATDIEGEYEIFIKTVKNSQTQISNNHFTLKLIDPAI